MNNLRLRNYRCFSDTGDIDIRSITLLIGANSTGKSSFLKFFPLLKQTIGEFVSGLFLWTGQLVDFKNFKNTIKDGSDIMTIGFTITDLPIRTKTRLKKEVLHNVRIEFTLCGVEDDEHYDYIRCMSVNFGEHSFLLECNEKDAVKLTVDSVDSKTLKDKIFIGPTNSLLPKIIFQVSEDEISEESDIAYKKMKGIMMEDDKIPFISNLIKSFDNVYDDSLLRKRLLSSDSPKIEEKDIKHFIDYLHYYTVNTLIDSINIYMFRLADRISYMKPLRAIVERYYRYTNQAVNEISADGSNLPMYYNSLSKDDKKSFNEWLWSLFKFTIDTKPSEGHLELQIKEQDKPVRNLVDVGFGYTQILPILTVVWKKIYKDASKDAVNGNQTAFLAIEQPELHLHPRFQGKFVEMLSVAVNDAKERQVDLRVIIETHSETIVNRLGELVADDVNPLKSEDVNILIFNSEQDNLGREITSSLFDKDGMLSNWPYGFFSDYVY